MNLPPSFRDERETLAKCLTATDEALPVQSALQFGFHCRCEARANSDVDLCLVAEGAERQLDAARQQGDAG